MKDSRRSLFVAALVVVAAVVIGVVCWRGPGPITPAGAGSPCAPSSASVRRMSRRDFVRWAATVEYDSLVDSLAGRPHGSGTSGITVYRARGLDAITADSIQDGCLIARIRSAAADSALGLGVGWTYVWADSINPYTATMVPEQETAPVTASELSILPSEPDPVTILSPRYICSDCGQGWCVYPRDETRLTPEAFQGS